jgi:hypothetical protein
MAERLTLTEEAYAALREKHPECVWVKGLQMGDLVLRPQTEAEYHAYSVQFWEKGGEPVAYRNALVQTAVFPDAATVQAWLKRWPGLPSNGKVSRALAYLCGMTDALEGKG